MMKTAGVTVLYNPDSNTVENAASYAGKIGTLFLVDNSDKPDSDVLMRLKALPGTVYLSNGGNIGIAKALNLGCIKALEERCEWLLTMDQDSRFEPGALESLLSYINRNDNSKTGIVSPFHIIENKVYELRRPEGVTELDTVMTSGNLLNLEAYGIAGPFMDDFFIDYVDIEYCLRLKKAGYQVLQVNDSILEHHLGNSRNVGKILVTHHSPVRRYYITRNRFFVIQKYKKYFPEICRMELRAFYMELLKILLFEKHKIVKLKMIWDGYRDFRKQKMGKYLGKI
jgi:rhamnosyltransferase